MNTDNKLHQLNKAIKTAIALGALAVAVVAVNPMTMLIASASTAPYAVTDTTGNQIPDEQEGTVDADVQNYLSGLDSDWKNHFGTIPKLTILTAGASGNLIHSNLGAWTKNNWEIMGPNFASTMKEIAKAMGANSKGHIVMGASHNADAKATPYLWAIHPSTTQTGQFDIHSYNLETGAHTKQTSTEIKLLSHDVIESPAWTRLGHNTMMRSLFLEGGQGVKGDNPVQTHTFSFQANTPPESKAESKIKQLFKVPDMFKAGPTESKRSLHEKQHKRNQQKSSDTFKKAPTGKESRPISQQNNEDQKESDDSN